MPPAPPTEGSNDADIARAAALTEHFTRIVALDPSRPVVLRGPRIQPQSQAGELQYRGADLTRTLPADLKARLARRLARGGCGPRAAHGRNALARPPRALTWAARRPGW